MCQIQFPTLRCFFQLQETSVVGDKLVFAACTIIIVATGHSQQQKMFRSEKYDLSWYRPSFCGKSPEWFCFLPHIVSEKLDLILNQKWIVSFCKTSFLTLLENLKWSVNPSYAFSVKFRKIVHVSCLESWWRLVQKAGLSVNTVVSKPLFMSFEI